MGRPKGGKKYWSKEEKIKLIKEHLEKHVSTNQITTREHISNGMYNNWLKTKDTLNQYEINRNDMCKLVKEYHKKHPSWGYRHINRQIRVDIGWYVYQIILFINVASF